MSIKKKLRKKYYIPKISFFINLRYIYIYIYSYIYDLFLSNLIFKQIEKIEIRSHPNTLGKKLY